MTQEHLISAASEANVRSTRTLVMPLTPLRIADGLGEHPAVEVHVGMLVEILRRTIDAAGVMVAGRIELARRSRPAVRRALPIAESICNRCEPA